MGVKKSTVCTRACPAGRRYTAASSPVSAETSTSSGMAGVPSRPSTWARSEGPSLHAQPAPWLYLVSLTVSTTCGGYASPNGRWPQWPLGGSRNEAPRLCWETADGRPSPTRAPRSHGDRRAAPARSGTGRRRGDRSNRRDHPLEPRGRGHVRLDRAGSHGPEDRGGHAGPRAGGGPRPGGASRGAAVAGRGGGRGEGRGDVPGVPHPVGPPPGGRAGLGDGRGFGGHLRAQARRATNGRTECCGPDPGPGRDAGGGRPAVAARGGRGPGVAGRAPVGDRRPDLHPAHAGGLARTRRGARVVRRAIPHRDVRAGDRASRSSVAVEDAIVASGLRGRPDRSPLVGGAVGWPAC